MVALRKKGLLEEKRSKNWVAEEKHGSWIKIESVDKQGSLGENLSPWSKQGSLWSKIRDHW